MSLYIRFIQKLYFMIFKSRVTLSTLHRFFFSLLIVLLPTQVGLHFWPEWAHVLGRRIDYLSPTLYLTDILICFVVVFWVIDHNWDHELRILNTGKKLTYILHVSVCIILLLIHIATSLSPALACYAWLKVFEFGLLIVYIKKTKPPLSIVHNSLLIALFYTSLIAIVQFFLHRSIGGPMWLLGERTFSASTPGIAQIPLYLDIGFWKFDFGLILRAYGTFPHPNVLGGFIAVVVPLLLGEYANKQVNQRIKNLYIPVCVLGIVALILTFSRSALVVCGMSMLILTVRDKKHLWGKTLLGLFVMFLLSLMIFSVHVTDESVVVRQALNISAIEIWKTHLWFGVGLGNFIVSLPLFLPSKLIYFLQPVHNIYLLLLSEMGIVGICVIVYILYFLFKNESQIMHTDKKIKHVIHTSLFMFLILGLVDHYPLTLQQGQLLLTLLIGLSIVEYNPPKTVLH